MKNPKPITASEIPDRARKTIEDLQRRIVELEEELAEAHDKIARLEAAACSETDAPMATARAMRVMLLKFSAKLTHRLFGVRTFSRSA